MGLFPGLGTPCFPEYDCSLHQEESLKRSWMIGEDLRRNTLAWYTCPDRCINAWLHPEDHQLRLENFYAPPFPQVGHWNSVLCCLLSGGCLRGTCKGDYKGDFRGDFKQDLEGDLLSSSGQVWSRSSSVSIELKFNSFELDSEVGRLVVSYSPSKASFCNIDTKN